MFIIKSDDCYGLLDMEQHTAYIKNERISIPLNSVFEPGDTIKLRSKTFVILNPDPQFFYRISGRRTQTILPVDAAYIIYTGSINGSKKILESGVGTGNLSYSILNSINASGKLVSVDIDKQNIENARKNVYSLMNPDNWELINGDIKTFKTEELFDTIILDMPEPWECVDNLKNNLKFGGYFITYSPTFNQAEKNVLSLNKNNFTVLETVELIKRNILVRENATRPDNNIIGHTAFITIAVKLNVL